MWKSFQWLLCVSKSERRVLWDDADGCPSCGAAVPSSAAYCPACGDDLETGPDRTEGVVCPDRDAVVSEGARCCSACGTKLADAADTPS
ncbi:zinc ribbon domain-containing protein [Natrinema ejinorense]|uniref:zinc ribbon domain-containing protein n=1 Tax=Natrinema ejinorense TaxID=373386 RepID=UPI0031842AA3